MKTDKLKTRKGRQRIRKGLHCQNSSEAKVLRRIMSETNLSEEEVYSIKKYRKILSEAQKNQHSNGLPTHINMYRRIKSDVLKRCTTELKLPKEHPKVKKMFKKEWEEYWGDIVSKGKRLYFFKEFDKEISKERSLLIEKDITTFAFK